ncbi:MAG: threonylcarbamoyl-AMP synthase [Alicyclobacillus herbarius]|uniref:L-threonylcarbamoyladenylate synthase n=1 Tax=Alicyclobacillus herbarius TaxID=122960 RepID=UPI0023520053|nr:L-threonylcarbamoyladenylate synthase [Alicyclobacillus herbarius]MCL6632987.1 threonylcarbamoyl-AMP synthase [Alicyclobacillus herbarius]
MAKVWQVNPDAGDAEWEGLAQAATLLKNGGLIAFPTETVYGLGANAGREEAVQRIFQVKERPADNPLIVHIADLAQLPDVVANPDELPAPARRAMEVFWPGPLTLILPVSDRIAAAVHPGTDTVGVRMPNHDLARELIRRAGCPVAAPSANKSGRPSPTLASDVIEDLGAEIDGVIDGGACKVGIESTVARISDDKAVIYRPGGITREQLQEALSIPVELAPQLTGEATDAGNVPSPGMKYRHYAPDAEVHVWWGDGARVLVAMMEFIDAHPGKSLAVISERPFAGRCKSWAPAPGEPYDAALAQHLYRLLREFDRSHVDYILVQGVAPDGVGAAVMNRLQKASAGRVYSV